MAYRITFKRGAEKELRKLDHTAYELMREAIGKLANKPRPRQAVKLVGSDNLWRVRVGDYRIVYEIQDKVLVVHIVRIGHRKEVYRK